MKTILMCCAICAASTVLAGTLTNTEGKVFSNVEILHKNPTGLFIAYKDGSRTTLTKLEFTDLPEDIQKKYGYDPAKSAEYKAASGQRIAEHEVQMQQDREKEVLAAQEKRAAEIAWIQMIDADRKEAQQLAALQAQQEQEKEEREADRKAMEFAIIDEGRMVMHQFAVAHTQQGYQNQFVEKHLRTEAYNAETARKQTTLNSRYTHEKSRWPQNQTMALENACLYNRFQKIGSQSRSLHGNTLQQHSGHSRYSFNTHGRCKEDPWNARQRL